MCPYASTDGDFISTPSQAGSGDDAVFSTNIFAPDRQNQITYSCSLNDGFQDCYYYQNAGHPGGVSLTRQEMGDSVYLGAINGAGTILAPIGGAECPARLCAAVKTGTPVTRRGLYLDERSLRVQRRQVDTRALRKRLQQARKRDTL